MKFHKGDIVYNPKCVGGYMWKIEEVLIEEKYVVSIMGKTKDILHRGFLKSEFIFEYSSGLLTDNYILYNRKIKFV